MRNNISEARRSYSLKVGFDVTQDMAANMFGVSSSCYKKWEQGVGKLNGEILCAIADKYECSTDYLLCRTSDPTPFPPPRQRPTKTADEERLLDAYRECTPRERGSILNMAETMADDGMAKNNPDGAAEERMGA